MYTDANGNVDCGFPKDTEFSTPPPVYFANDDGSWYKHETNAWNIGSNSNGFGDKYPIATARDFEQLYLTPHIQFGYGVLYADGATETQMSVNDAYGWYRRDIDGEVPDNRKGMRGMFAYYWNVNDPNNAYTAKNVFFPIGRSGYGHRKNTRSTASNNEKAGTLRYSCGRSSYADVFEKTAPLFCSLYRRPGAIYWARNAERIYKSWDDSTTDVDKDIPNPDNRPGARMFGLDINYFTFDVNAIQGSNMDNGADACFIRCVE